MDIHCFADSCAHNESHICDASVIQVRAGSGNTTTFCNTYTDSDADFVITGAEHTMSSGGDRNNPDGGDIQGVIGDGILTTRFADTEISTDLSMSPRVACTVSGCRFNRHYSCNADSLAIDNIASKGRTSCKTFQPR